jgi:hypothetical protein
MADMKILISNDDGFTAPGIVALYEALRGLADVEVVAPEHNNSAKSNALTLHSPLSVHTAPNGFRYVNGTPADCVHIALTGLLGYRPDLVVSGINNGANMGDDTIYSGTVGAAMEGYLFGIPSIAFSQTHKGWQHLDVAAQHAARPGGRDDRADAPEGEADGPDDDGPDRPNTPGRPEQAATDAQDSDQERCGRRPHAQPAQGAGGVPPPGGGGACGAGSAGESQGGSPTE